MQAYLIHVTGFDYGSGDKNGTYFDHPAVLIGKFCYSMYEGKVHRDLEENCHYDRDPNNMTLLKTDSTISIDDNIIKIADTHDIIKIYIPRERQSTGSNCVLL